jgi:hypothetical protein
MANVRASPSFHCFNYPPLPFIEVPADNGLPPSQADVDADLETAGRFEETSEVLSVDQGCWASQAIAAGGLAREADDLAPQFPKVAGPPDGPRPIPYAPASPPI